MSEGSSSGDQGSVPAGSAETSITAHEATTNGTLPAAKRPRKPVLALVAVLLVVGGLTLAVKHTRHYFIAKRFAVVEPGKLYRSGYCEPGPLARLLRDHQIRTILTLLRDEPESKEQQNELAVAADANVRMIRIGMPGDGRAEFELLDQAADVIADSANYPLLVHCHAGVNRTGASYAAWRMKYCGWTLAQALAEAEEHGMSRGANPELFVHLEQYAGRLLPATASAETQASR